MSRVVGLVRGWLNLDQTSEEPSQAADDSDPLAPREQVVAAADDRIRDRGLAEFKAVIDRMAEDPSWAPDPLDLIAAGIPESDGDADFLDPSEVDEQWYP